MPEYFAVLTLVLMVGLVMTRVILLRQRGIAAMQFGKIDKTDFLLPPFALFYFYLVFADAFDLPTVSAQEFLHSETVAWLGVLLCFVGLSLFACSLVSFGQSFRVGIDTENSDKLVTSGVFAFSRNPIYVAFAVILFAEFLIFPNWILLA
jgi:protein-S-isoprenylcysteine O-methyltransferase Ste14